MVGSSVESTIWIERTVIIDGEKKYGDLNRALG
jgi:hypothetical protein